VFLLSLVSQRLTITSKRLKRHFNISTFAYVILYLCRKEINRLIQTTQLSNFPFNLKMMHKARVSVKMSWSKKTILYRYRIVRMHGFTSQCI
jgi:hypothetical protein